MRLKDLTGKQFENLIVLYRAEDVIKDGKKKKSEMALQMQLWK